MPIKKTARSTRSALGADYARVWARTLKLGNPYAKAILLAVANYMNEDGIAWPGVPTISRDTDISEDTVVGRLRWLENIGAIVVIKCWVDENGRRNYDRRGRATSSEIRFVYDSEPEDIEAAATCARPAQSLRGAALASKEARASEAATETQSDAGNNDDGDDDAGYRQRRGSDEDVSDTGLPPVSTRLAPDSPPPPSARSLESELEDYPPKGPPQAGGFRSDAPLYRIEDFKSAYPIPITNWQRFEPVWRALTDQERDEAITGARGYASLCKKQPNRGVKDAHRWLKNREWIGFLEQGKTAETIAARIEAEDGSTQWRIWKTVIKIAKGRDEFPNFWLIAGTNRATLPKALPEALIEIANPQRQWVEVAEGDGGHFASWLRWIGEILPANFINIRTVDGKRTLRVPDIWPPRKDGSLGPPKEDSTAA